MRSIHPFVAAAGALLVFATGYAFGASGDDKDPYLNTKVLASSSAPTLVSGPEADPPPWPGGPAAQAAQAAALAPAAGTPAVTRPAPVSPAAPVAAAAAPAAAPQLISSTTAPPADTQRVAPDSASSPALAMNLSSALAPVEHPVAPVPDKDVMTAPDTTSAAVPADDGASRLRARRIMQKQVTFGTTARGRPVTIIWNN